MKKRVSIKKPLRNPKFRKVGARPIAKKPTVAFEKTMEPVKTLFGIKNILQAIVGAIILAIPIGFTEETWKLRETLPLSNTLIIRGFSLFFVTLFVYRNLSKNKSGFYWYDLTKRIITMYVLSFVIVTFLLLVIQRAPWTTDWILAFKREQLLWRFHLL